MRKPTGPPVVLHEECVAIQMQLFRKVLHDFSERIEGISELRVIWPRGMTETGIVRRDQMIFFAQAGFQQRLIHPGGRRHPM